MPNGADQDDRCPCPECSAGTRTLNGEPPKRICGCAALRKGAATAGSCRLARSTRYRGGSPSSSLAASVAFRSSSGISSQEPASWAPAHSRSRFTAKDIPVWRGGKTKGAIPRPYPSSIYRPKGEGRPVSRSMTRGDRCSTPTAVFAGQVVACALGIDVQLLRQTRSATEVLFTIRN